MLLGHTPEILQRFFVGMKVRLRIDENAGPNLESNQAENSAPNTFRRTNRISTLGSKKAAHSEMSSLKAAKESFFAYSLPGIGRRPECGPAPPKAAAEYPAA